MQFDGALIGFPGGVAAHKGDDPGAEAGIEGCQLAFYLIIGEIADLDGVVGTLAGADATTLAGQLIDNGPVIPGDGAMGAEAVAGQAIMGGVSSSAEQVANYYLEMAKNIFPIIEIDAGRRVDFVMVRGMSLNPKSKSGQGTNLQGGSQNTNNNYNGNNMNSMNNIMGSMMGGRNSQRGGSGGGYNGYGR